MRSNMCYLFDGNGIEDVLKEVEKTAKYCELNHRQSLHLRLLAEELTGMINRIAGDYEAKFWIQTNYNICELHMELELLMDAEKKKQLMEISTAEAKSQSLMSRICDFIEKNIMENIYCVNGGPVMHYNSMIRADAMIRACYMGRNAINWSLVRYIDSLEEMNETDEIDNLEKSIVTKLADDILVKISGNRAEMIIKKIFK